MKNETEINKYSVYFLTFLRISVGWYFLYEGISKLVDPEWTARYYLMGSRWIFGDVFGQMASSPAMMTFIDLFNTWGLILIGLALATGLFVHWFSLAGSALLLLYYVAYPPLPGYTFGALAEGSYLVVNKTLIQFFLLLGFAFLPGNFLFGGDRLIKRWKEEKAHSPIPTGGEKGSLQRRELLRDLISLPFLGAFAYALYKKRSWDSWEEKFLAGHTDAATGATLLSFNFASLQDLKGPVPKGKIGGMDLSRLVMGGNLIGGWAHARDLIYVSQLVKGYHTDERVMMTLQLAERCGIDAIITNPQLSRIVNKYWRETGGRMKFISDCGSFSGGLIEGARISEEAGAAAMYTHGGFTDSLVREDKFDEIIKCIELVRSYGKPAGIGAHLLETVQKCVDRGIRPDFWVKTFHFDNYWSAQVDTERKDVLDPEYKDNIYCFNPNETIEFMNRLEEPWIAFKVLAAGSIPPREGFKAAFDAGADFICVGMYDFQIVEDCNITLEILQDVNRDRPWRG